MIRRLHVENFKCLRDVTVDFTPLTVLIGPNDGGKSSILKALHLLSQMQRECLSRSDGDNTRTLFPADELHQLVWRRDASRDILWQVDAEAEEQPFRYEVRLPGAPLNPSSEKRIKESFASGSLRYQLAPVQNRDDKTFLALGFDGYCAWQIGQPYFSAALKTTELYKLEPDAIRRPSLPAPQPVLSSTGDNLATVLEAMMTGPDRQSLHGLETTLYETLPSLRGISAPTISTRRSGGQAEIRKALEFVLAGKERPPVTIPATQVSDGALLLTAYLALVYSDSRDIILIEEPENGLHPTRLKLIVELLRRVTLGTAGNHQRQIVITTHSPLLLNYCHPEEVRFVCRGPDGDSQVTPLTAVPDPARLLSAFSLGEL